MVTSGRDDTRTGSGPRESGSNRANVRHDRSRSLRRNAPRNDGRKRLAMTGRESIRRGEARARRDAGARARGRGVPERTFRPRVAAHAPVRLDASPRLYRGNGAGSIPGITFSAFS
jgi:hypothetical protein